MTLRGFSTILLMGAVLSAAAYTAVGAGGAAPGNGGPAPAAGAGGGGRGRGRGGNAAPPVQVPQNPAATYDVTISVDAGTSIGAMNPIWRWCGYDEPNYTYAPNGKKLIQQFTGGDAEKAEFGAAFFRTHSLLVTGDGTPHLKWGSTNAYTEDAQGNPVYSWTILDKIFDTYHDAGAKPYVQIGFMPKAAFAEARAI